MSSNPQFPLKSIHWGPKDLRGSLGWEPDKAPSPPSSVTVEPLAWGLVKGHAESTL